MGKSPCIRILVVFASSIIISTVGTAANSSQDAPSSTPETYYPVAEAVFSSNLIPNALMILGSVMVNYTILYCTVLYYIVLTTVLYHILLYCNVLYHPVFHSTAQYYAL